MAWMLNGTYGQVQAGTWPEVVEKYFRLRNNVIREDWRWLEEKIQEEIIKACPENGQLGLKNVG